MASALSRPALENERIRENDRKIMITEGADAQYLTRGKEQHCTRHQLYYIFPRSNSSPEKTSTISRKSSRCMENIRAKYSFSWKLKRCMNRRKWRRIT